MLIHSCTFQIPFCPIWLLFEMKLPRSALHFGKTYHFELDPFWPFGPAPGAWTRWTRPGVRALMLPGAALGSLAARFCWQGQHFRLWTVPERVSGPPPLDAARRSTWQPRGSFLLTGAALQALDGTRARFGAPLLMLPGAALGSLARVSGPPPLDAARRSTWEPRCSFLLAGAALQALNGI